jgi:hypothetical protein
MCIRSLHANRLHKCLLVYIELVNNGVGVCWESVEYVAFVV